ncbi:hypothetical protein E3N88_01695 [Mikania micrantha]|uniref:Isopropylmalate dehydrogenase-like domain-containing protein n=1 Tax=Mikania micrantha TaxID=192012 RepID=A0A5N6Q1T7_9ASTR|nr:hypothetical protein E3N88_01695 [Mikania micrantha]
MTCVFWQSIKDKLVFPFLDLDIKCYDLELPNHDAINDKVTIESAEATLKHNVEIKCATITPGRHAFGDQYKATDAVIKGPGKLKPGSLHLHWSWLSSFVNVQHYEVCPDGKTIEAEAAHGTPTRYYRVHQSGWETSTNSIASIFSWTRGLAHWAKLDNNLKRLDVTEKLEATCIGTLESWRMTKDHSIFMDPRVGAGALAGEIELSKTCTSSPPVDIGILRIRLNNQWLTMALIGGFARIGNNKITVLVNDAEKSNDIDPQKAQQTLEIAEAVLRKAEGKR